MEPTSILNWKIILGILAALVVGYLIGKHNSQKKPDILGETAEKITKQEPKPTVKEAAKADKPNEKQEVNT